MKMSLDEIAALCEGKVIGDGSKMISGVNTFEKASSDDIVFLSDPRFEKQLADSNAGALLSKNGAAVDRQNRIVVEDPKLAFAIVAEKFNIGKMPVAGVSETARVDTTTHIPSDCFVGDYVTIGKNVVLGNGVIIYSGSHIENDCAVGKQTVIHQNVVVKSQTRIGDGCIIHSGVILGGDGFGLVQEQQAWRRIPQLGGLVIGNNVDIGCNTTVDRGALGDTVLGDGIKLDNLIQIGHNVKIGAHTVIAAHTAVAGSTVIGEHCEIGGCVGIMDHSEITDNVKIGGGSVISGKISKPGIYSSSIKAEKLSAWQKNVAWLRKLSSLADRIKKLESKD